MGCEWLNTGGRWIPHTLVSQCGCSVIPCVATAGSGLWCRLQLHSALLAAWCSWDGRRWAEVGTGHEDGESTKAASWQGACCLLQGPYHSKLEPVPRDMQPWSWVAKDNYGWKESCVFVWEGLGGHRRKWMKYVKRAAWMDQPRMRWAWKILSHHRHNVLSPGNSDQC